MYRYYGRNNMVLHNLCTFTAAMPAYMITGLCTEYRICPNESESRLALSPRLHHSAFFRFYAGSTLDQRQPIGIPTCRVCAALGNQLN